MSKIEVTMKNLKKKVNPAEEKKKNITKKFMSFEQNLQIISENETQVIIRLPNNNFYII